ncbi:hypothetical protein HMPREF9586_01196 [Cutibacterium acnes HL083PA2]|nr:hypothetical protein HMPREF9586_01196 [Cutibacterium acnes HL083PA2]
MLAQLPGNLHNGCGGGVTSLAACWWAPRCSGGVASAWIDGVGLRSGTGISIC